MIRVELAPEPADFNSKVRQPGLRAMAELVGEPNLPKRRGRKREVIASSRDEIPADKFPALWTEALPELLDAYGRVCAYMSFYIEPVTGAASVDHMLPKSLNWQEVYEWRNYRLACAQMNSRKNDYQDVLDPFEIEDSWFRIELVGYQVIPATQLPAGIEAQVQATVSATLRGFNPNLVRASASLGGNPVYTFFRVTLPLIAPGVISGGLFAFAASFDEVVVTLFLAGPEQTTLPRQMFAGIKENISPTIAAAATVLILFSIVLLLTLEWLRGRSEKMRTAASAA